MAVGLAGCASDPLAEQYRAGTGQGYISGDGAYTVIAPDDRSAPVSFDSVPLDSGESISSADLDGQVYVVNFWYASCPPCRVEAPDLESLYQQFRDAQGGTGVPFLGVNIRDDAAQSLTFAKEFGVTYPSILDLESGAVRLAFAGQVSPTAVPTTLVVDAEGRVAARISGLISDPSTLRAMITDTLAESD
ncbi:MAG: TlpA family protein disulfide reductase [Actinomycetes bacterium]